MSNKDLRIVIQASLDTSTQAIGTINKQIEQIAEKLKTLNLTVNVDSKNLNNLTQQLEIITRQLKTKPVEVIDKNQMIDGQKLYATLQQVINEYSKLGTVKITNESLNPITRSLQSFSIEIEKADKKIEKLKFDLMNITDGDKISPMFTATKLNQLDKIAANKQAMVNAAHVEAEILNKQFDQYQQYLRNIDRIEAEAYVVHQKRQSLIGDNRIYDQTKAYDEALKTNGQFNAKMLKQEEDFAKKKADLIAKIQDAQRRYAGDPNSGQLNDVLANARGINSLENYKSKLGEVDTKLKQVTSTMTTAKSNNISFSESFSTAMTKFPVWIIYLFCPLYQR